VRPATPLICEFIDEHRDRFGVAPICRALGVHGLQIAPRTYWAHRSAAPSKWALWDTTITEILAGVYEPDTEGRRPPESLYGYLKMWAHLQRQRITVARCTVERIMGANGWRGATRARRQVRTTVADPAATRAPDLVGRQFRVEAPNRLLVADFTYVPMSTGGFGYTAFVIDAYAELIPGWECSLSKQTAFVEHAIRHAATHRARDGHPLRGDTIPHRDNPGRPETSFQGDPQLVRPGSLTERPHVVPVVRHDLHEELVLLMCGRGVGLSWSFVERGRLRRNGLSWRR
jgi:putative transposase